MTTVRLEIEYDGTGFRGWARQPGLRTVQGVLEEGLATVLREEIGLTVAGRTDTGVHALGQVASFATVAALPPDLARNLNGVTPEDVAVRGAVAVADGFDARRDARSRSYLYRVATTAVISPFERGRALWWPHRVDGEALDACAAALHGTHDFTAFTPTQTDHVRFERDVFAASWTGRARSCSSSASPPTPSCATWCAPWSGRCWASPQPAARSRASAPSWRAHLAPRAATRRHRMASTWSRSATSRRGPEL